MIKKYKSKLINQSILFILGIFCLSGVIKLQSWRVNQLTHNNLTKENYFQQEKAMGLKLSFLKKMPTFGFDNIIADWTMLMFLQYFGDGQAREQTGYSLSADYLEVIAQNDPLFSRAYIIISPAASMFAGTPERTVAIMNKGLSQMSPDITDAYYVWLYKGTDEILFLGDLKEARKSYLKASEWADKAKNEKIARSAINTAKFLGSKPDASQAQVGAWFTVWNNAKDERIRQLAEAKIESIGGELKVYPDGRVEAIPPKISKS